MQPGYMPPLAHGVPGNYPQVYNQSNHQNPAIQTQFNRPGMNMLSDVQGWRLKNQFGYHDSNAAMLAFENYGFRVAPSSLGGYPSVPPKYPSLPPYPTYYGVQPPQASLTPQPHMQPASHAHGQYANALGNNRNVAACSLPGNAQQPTPSHITSTAYGLGFFPTGVSTSAPATPAPQEQAATQFYQYQPSFPSSVNAPSHDRYGPPLGFNFMTPSNSLVSSSKPQGDLVGSRSSMEQNISLEATSSFIAQNKTLNHPTSNSSFLLSALLQSKNFSTSKLCHETLRAQHSVPPVPFSVCESSVSASNKGNNTFDVSKSLCSQNSPLPLTVFRNSSVSVNSNLECSHHQENRLASTSLDLSKQHSHQDMVSFDIPLPSESPSVMPGHQHALTINNLTMKNISLSVSSKTDHFKAKTGPSVQAKRGRKSHGAIKRLANHEQTGSLEHMSRLAERLLNVCEGMPTTQIPTQPLASSAPVQKTLPLTKTGVESSCQCTRSPLICVLHNPLRSPVTCAGAGDQVSVSRPENPASHAQNPVNATTEQPKDSPGAGACHLHQRDVDIMKETYTTVEEHDVDMYRTCLVCKETFTSISQLEDHLSMHISPETEPSQTKTDPLLQTTVYLDMPDVSGLDDISDSPLTPNSMTPINEQACDTNGASVNHCSNQVNRCNENSIHGQQYGGDKSQQEQCTEIKEPKFYIIMESHDDNSTETEPQNVHTSEGNLQSSDLSTLLSPEPVHVECVDKSHGTNPTEGQQTMKPESTHSPDRTKSPKISRSSQHTHKPDKSQQEQCTETTEPKFYIIMESHDDNATETEPQNVHTSERSLQGSDLSALLSPEPVQVKSVDKSHLGPNPTEGQQTMNHGSSHSPDHTETQISHSSQHTHKLDNEEAAQMFDNELPVIMKKKKKRDDGRKVTLWKPLTHEQHRDKVSKSWNVRNGSDNLKTQTSHSKDTHSVSKVANETKVLNDNHHQKMTAKKHGQDKRDGKPTTEKCVKHSHDVDKHKSMKGRLGADEPKRIKHSHDADKSKRDKNSHGANEPKRDKHSKDVDGPKRNKRSHGADEPKRDIRSQDVGGPKHDKHTHGADEPKHDTLSHGLDEPKRKKRRHGGDDPSLSVICADEVTHLRKSAIEKQIQHIHGINASSLSIQCAVEEMRIADFENSSSPKYLEPLPELKRNERNSEKSVFSHKSPVSHKRSLSLKGSGHERKRSHKEHVTGATEVKNHQLKNTQSHQSSTAHKSLKTCSLKCKQDTCVDSCVSGKENLSKQMNVTCNCDSTLSSLPNTHDRSTISSSYSCEPSISCMAKMPDIAEFSSPNKHEAAASSIPRIHDITKPPTPNICSMAESSSSKEQNLINATPMVCLEDVSRNLADKSGKKWARDKGAIVKSSSKLHKTHTSGSHGGRKHRLAEQSTQETKATKKQTPDLASSLKPKLSQSSDSQKVHDFSPGTPSETKHTGGVETSKPSDYTSTEHERQQSEIQHHSGSFQGLTSSIPADPKSALGQRIVNSLRHLLKNKCLPHSSTTRQVNHIPRTDIAADDCDTVHNIKESSSKDVDGHLQVPKKSIEIKSKSDGKFSKHPQIANLVKSCGQPTNTIVTDIIFCVKCMTVFANRHGYQKHGCCVQINSEDSDSESEDGGNVETCSADTNGDHVKIKQAQHSVSTLNEKSKRENRVGDGDVDNNNTLHKDKSHSSVQANNNTLNKDKNQGSVPTKLVSMTQDRKMCNGKIKKPKKQCKGTSRNFHEESLLSECQKPSKCKDKGSKPVSLCKKKVSQSLLCKTTKDSKPVLCKTKKDGKPVLLCKIKTDSVRNPTNRKKNISGQSMFHCDQCSQTYSSQGGLLFHNQTVHKQSGV